jgi:hypothetical protein
MQKNEKHSKIIVFILPNAIPQSKIYPKIIKIVSIGIMTELRCIFIANKATIRKSINFDATRLLSNNCGRRNKDHAVKHKEGIPNSSKYFILR